MLVFLMLILQINQKVVIRRKDLGTRLKGAGRQVVVDGIATRAGGMPAVVVAGGKLVPESAAPDLWACT